MLYELKFVSDRSPFLTQNSTTENYQERFRLGDPPKRAQNTFYDIDLDGHGNFDKVKKQLHGLLLACSLVISGLFKRDLP